MYGGFKIKTRNSFVSNSSSTSFVVDAKKEMKTDEFIEWITLGIRDELEIWFKEYEYCNFDEIYKGENMFTLERSYFKDFKDMFRLAKRHIPALEDFEIVEQYEEKIIKERRI